MDSDEVFRLHREGWSARRIAKRVGWSRMRVHRLLTRDNPSDPPIELGGDDYEPIPPFVFVGMEADEPGQRQYEWFLDGNLVSCNVLDIYRWCARQGPERGDYEAGKWVWADVDRQIAAAGWVKADDPARPGYWH